MCRNPLVWDKPIACRPPFELFMTTLLLQVYATLLAGIPGSGTLVQVVVPILESQDEE
jgi:hypothetical protein